MLYNVIDSIWFNNIGIVAIETEMGETKWYIGNTAGLGSTREVDEQLIAAHGTPVYPDALDRFFKMTCR